MKIHPGQNLDTQNNTQRNLLLQNEDKLTHTTTKRGINGATSTTYSEHGSIMLYNKFEIEVNQLISLHKKIANSKLIENIAGVLMNHDQKQQALNEFALQYHDLVDTMNRIKNLCKQMSFWESSYQDEESFSDQIIAQIKDIQGYYQNLVAYSSIRYLKICCEIHKLDMSQITLDFPSKKWAWDIIDHISRNKLRKRGQSMSSHQELGTCISFKKYESNQQYSQSKKTPEQEKNTNQKSFVQKIFCCFYSESNNKQQIHNNNKIQTKKQHNQNLNQINEEEANQASQHPQDNQIHQQPSRELFKQKKSQTIVHPNNNNPNIK